MPEVIITEEQEPLSVVVPIDDMRDIVKQLWKSRNTETKCGELYYKYKELITWEKCD
tara:strand:- start:887 stop:1057 length:171 start_codon:yes stop_codon:yes gene_type:complete